MKKFIFLLFFPIFTYAFDSLLMKHCYHKDTASIRHRCEELMLEGEEGKMDCLLAQMYVSYKTQRTMPLSFYIEMIDEILKKYCEE